MRQVRGFTCEPKIALFSQLLFDQVNKTDKSNLGQSELCPSLFPFSRLHSSLVKSSTTCRPS